MLQLMHYLESNNNKKKTCTLQLENKGQVIIVSQIC